MKMKMYMVMLAVIAASLLSLTGCDDEREIPYSKLPAAAKNFIETYFPKESCVYAQREKEDGRKEYEARLSNGTELEFNQLGEWKKVDCKFSTLPEGIVPQKIKLDIQTRYQAAGIYKAEREYGGYEISIGNGLELIYSEDGTFIREERY